MNGSDFNFPRPVPGPFGLPLSDPPARGFQSRAPLPVYLRRRQLDASTSGTRTAVEVDRPTILQLLPDGLSTATALRLSYGPAPYDSDLEPGAIRARDRIYLWAPGRWYVQAQTLGGSETLTFAEIDASYDQLAAFVFDDDRANYVDQILPDLSLAAMMQTNAFSLAQVVGATCLRIQNVGSNEVRYGFASSVAAASGLALAAGEAATFEGRGLPLSQLYVYSDAGTTIARTRSKRFD